MNKRLIGVIGVLVVAIIGLYIYSNTINPSRKDDLAYIDKLDTKKLITTDNLKEALAKTDNKELSASSMIPDHYVGNLKSKVTVIEYADFACPHCHEANSFVNKIQDEYKDKVLFIYRHFNLGFPNSQKTIAASEAAYKVGGEDAFWKMHNLLFNDSAWIGNPMSDDQKNQLILKYAKDLKLDEKAFKDAMNNTSNNDIYDKIRRDRKIGEKMGVDGTPSWFVNGKKVEQLTEGSLKQDIQKALDDTK